MMRFEFKNFLSDKLKILLTGILSITVFFPPLTVTVFAQESIESISSSHEQKVEQNQPETKKITFNFQDADIREVLGTFEVVSKKKFIVSENVSGTITAKLENVPWDEALKIISSSNHLVITEKEDALYIDRAINNSHGTNEKLSDRLRDSVIFFKGGSTLRGEIIEQTSLLISVRTGDGVVHVRQFSQVEKIIEGDSGHQAVYISPVSKKWYVGVYWVRSFEKLDVQQTMDKFSGELQVNFDDSTGFQLRGGYSLNQFLAVEAVFEHLYPFQADFGNNNTDDLTVKNLFINSKVFMPLSKNYVPISLKTIPYLLFGVGVMNAYEEIAFEGDTSKTNNSGPALRYGFGMDIQVNQSYFTNLDLTYTSGMGDVEHIRFLNLAIGICYRF